MRGKGSMSQTREAFAKKRKVRGLNGIFSNDHKLLVILIENFACLLDLVVSIEDIVSCGQIGS